MSDKKTLAVIPARFASTRFPGKPLALLGGKPIIEWVYERALACDLFDDVIVATDDARIVEAVEEFGGNACLTSGQHTTGTDRVAEVLELSSDYDIAVNIQGDQPFITPEMLQGLVRPLLSDASLNMSTLACPLSDSSFRDNPNVVKVLCNQKMEAIYFSRAAVPYEMTPVKSHVFHHLGVYAFRASFLQVFTKLEQTPLEICEQLEQLRVIENGHRIGVSLVDRVIIEVNTPDDLVAANRQLAEG